MITTGTHTSTQAFRVPGNSHWQQWRGPCPWADHTKDTTQEKQERRPIEHWLATNSRSEFILCCILFRSCYKHYSRTAETRDNIKAECILTTLYLHVKKGIWSSAVRSSLLCCPIHLLMSTFVPITCGCFYIWRSLRKPNFSLSYK